MKTYRSGRVLVAALASVAMASLAHPVLASIEDYEFQLVQPTVPVGPETEILVRLVNKVTGKPATDAVIFATRLDMAPDAMAEMKADLEVLPPIEPGIYRFKATFGMEGRWQLSLAAKVQGLRETVQSRLVLKASN